MTYSEARELLATARNAEAGKPIANNTRIFERKREGRQSDYAIRLHETDIITLHGDGYATLNTGGWYTVTTKERINRFSPARVYSLNGVWAIRGGVGNDCEFFDGMKISPDGFPVEERDLAPRLKARTRLNRKVRTYVDGFAEHVLQYVEQHGHMDTPDGGDCWGCCLTATDQPVGKPHGDAMGWGHILNHFEERYYVPSLLWNAIRSRGYRDPSFIWHVIDGQAKRGDDGMLKDVLRSYFRRIKPNLLPLFEDDQATVSA